MPVIVTLNALKEFLGGAIAAAEEELLTALLDDVEALFTNECGRGGLPFKGTADDAPVTVVLDGSGTPIVFVAYPIVAVTAVTLGPDPARPFETLDPANPVQLQWVAGSRRIARVDGGVFGWTDQPGYVRIAYTRGADVPTTAAIAIKRVTAALYRQLGAEDVKSERLAGYHRELAVIADDDPLWRRAVGHAARWAVA